MSGGDLEGLRAGLKRIGIRPESVDDVILTHMHYDHAGNRALFPKARYHVQDKEMAWKANGTRQYQELARRSLAAMKPCDPLPAIEAEAKRGH